MRKRFGPVRVRRSKYPLLLTNEQADLRRGGRKTESYGPFKGRDNRDKDKVSDTPRRTRLKIFDSDSRPVSVRYKDGAGFTDRTWLCSLNYDSVAAGHFKGFIC